MRGILLLNGTPYKGEINAEGALVYCCDGAYDWAKGRIKIDKNIGDFDSLPYTPTPPPEEIYPAEKDCTDGEIALNKLIADGATEVIIYGGDGGREDHFLGNIHLLYSALKRGVKARMITRSAEIFAAGGRIEFKDLKGRTISLLPFGGTVHILGSSGLKYAYPKEIAYGSCRGISNVVISEAAQVTVGDGDTALIFINRE